MRTPKHTHTHPPTHWWPTQIYHPQSNPACGIMAPRPRAWGLALLCLLVATAATPALAQCPAGTARVGNSTNCTGCAKGTFSPGGAAPCAACPPCYTTPGVNSTSNTSCGELQSMVFWVDELVRARCVSGRACADRLRPSARVNDSPAGSGHPHVRALGSATGWHPPPATIPLPHLNPDVQSAPLAAAVTAPVSAPRAARASTRPAASPPTRCPAATAVPAARRPTAPRAYLRQLAMVSLNALAARACMAASIFLSPLGAGRCVAWRAAAATAELKPPAPAPAVCLSTNSVPPWIRWRQVPGLQARLLVWRRQHQSRRQPDAKLHRLRRRRNHCLRRLHERRQLQLWVEPYTHAGMQRVWVAYVGLRGCATASLGPGEGGALSL